jgi:hypothetical protein
MKDNKGIYYYPFPQNKRVRMYVRTVGADICFRMWNADDEKLWEEHGWVSYEAVKQAAGMYEGKGFNPGKTYDIEAAKALIRDEEMG